MKKLSSIIIIAVATVSSLALLVLITSSGSPFVSSNLQYPTILRIVEDIDDSNEVIQLSEQEIRLQYPELYNAIIELEGNKKANINNQDDVLPISINLTMAEISEIEEFFIQKHAEIEDGNAAEEQLDFAHGVGFTYNGIYYEYITEVATAASFQ